MIGRKKRDRLVAIVRAATEQWIKKHQVGGKPEWYCPIIAAFTTHMLAKHGLQATFQAGSCGWPRLRPEQDDGRVSTHFSYQWNGNEARSFLMRGTLPEIHCWAAVKEGEDVWIIDTTTKSWPERCKMALGLDWPGVLPPDYLWHLAQDIPPGAIYEPFEEACQVGQAFALSGITGDPLVIKMPKVTL